MINFSLRPALDRLTRSTPLMRSFTPIERTFISLSEYRESKVFRAKAIIETSNPHVKSVRYYFNEFFLSSESQINENRERTIPKSLTDERRSRFSRGRETKIRFRDKRRGAPRKRAPRYFCRGGGGEAATRLIDARAPRNGKVAALLAHTNLVPRRRT